MTLQCPAEPGKHLALFPEHGLKTSYLTLQARLVLVLLMGPLRLSDVELSE